MLKATMLKGFVVFALVGAAVVSFGAFASVEGARLSYPKVFFSYSSLYDSTVCPPDKAPVDPTWAAEAARRVPEFEAFWDREAPALLGQVISEFGKGFSRRELTATLSVCPASWSYSNPLVLRVLNFLRSYREPLPVWPDHAFANLVFHELLHTWLDENFSFSSPLLTKYRDEAPGVLAHLHLMAIQKHVYAALGRQDLLEWVNELYPKIQGAERRAWEIVTLEGEARFVSELKGVALTTAREWLFR